MPGAAECLDRVIRYFFSALSRDRVASGAQYFFGSRAPSLPSLYITGMHLRRSLGLVALTTATLASAATPLGVISAAGEGVVRFGLRNVLRLNESSIDMILNRGERPLDPHPYASECLPRSLRTSTPLTRSLLSSRLDRRQLVHRSRDRHSRQRLCAASARRHGLGRQRAWSRRVRPFDRLSLSLSLSFVLLTRILPQRLASVHRGARLCREAQLEPRRRFVAETGQVREAQLQPGNRPRDALVALAVSPLFERVARVGYTSAHTRFLPPSPPVIVIATNKTRDLRFIKPTLLRPSAESFAELMSKPEIWQVLPVWRGSLAPGGR